MQSYPTGRPTINADEIRAALEAFHPPGAVFEVRALNVEFSGHAPATYSGIFTDARIAAESVEILAGTSGAYYVTIQVVNPLLAAKRTDRLRKSRGGDTTSDKDVMGYRWLPIDVDPVREVSGIMASDDERRHAESIADEMQFDLAARGWPEPIVSDSGNGRHLLYRVDLPASDAPLVKAALEALDNGYSRREAKVDTAVFNPARIWRLPGTTNRKGADARDMGRPWRKAAILSRPTDPGIVTREQLEQLVRDMGKPPETAHVKASRVGPTSSSFDVRAWIAKHITPQGIETNERQEAGRTVFQLSGCPMCADHDASYAPSISEDADGRLGFKCFGSRCQNIGWRELRERFEPMATRATPPAPVATTATNGKPVDRREDEPPEDEPPQLELFSMAQLRTSFPKLREPFIDGLLRRGEVMNVVAPPKVGKSWLVHGLALSVATGREWLGFQAVRGKVLLVDNELHRETLTSRLDRVADVFGINPEDIADTLTVAPVRGQGFDINKLALALSGCAPRTYDLVILDAWYRFLPPGCDENKNADVTAVYNQIDRIAGQLDASFVIVHHASKGNQSGKAVTDVGAGAGAQSRAADVHLTLRAHKQAGAFCMDTAVRSFKPVDSRCFRFSFPVWQAADDLDPRDLDDGKKAKSGGANNKPDAPPWDMYRFVDEFVGTFPMSKTDIVARASKADGLSEREALRLFRLAEGKELIHLWPNPSDGRVKLYASVKPELLVAAE